MLWALLAVVSAGSARAMDVTFDASLTNKTGWTYSEVKYGAKGCYLGSGKAAVTSPPFSFAVTSLTVVVSTTSVADNARRLKARPFIGDGAEDGWGDEADVTPSAANERQSVTVAWDAADGVRRVALHSTAGSAGNLYLHSASILGVTTVEAPADVWIDGAMADRFSISWTNPPNAVSNVVSVWRVTRRAEEGLTVAAFDFDSVSNGGATTGLTQSVLRTCGDFEGEGLYLPANSAGLIQISKSKGLPGLLAYKGEGVAHDTTLVIAAAKPKNVPNMVGLDVLWTSADGAETNLVENVALGYAMATNFVPLCSVPAGASVVLRPSPNSSGDRRVVLDSIAFVRGYSPAAVETELAFSQVVEGAATATARGLSAYAEHLVTVVAFDANGVASEPSEAVAAWTNGKRHPLAVKLR